MNCPIGANRQRNFTFLASKSIFIFLIWLWPDSPFISTLLHGHYVINSYATGNRVTIYILS